MLTQKTKQMLSDWRVKIPVMFFFSAQLLMTGVMTGCAQANSLQPPPIEGVLPDDPSKEGGERDEAPPANPDPDFARLPFIEPVLSFAEEEQIVSRYSYVDTGGVVPEKLLRKALVYYNANRNELKNKTYLTVVDFSSHSSRPRFHIVNMNTGVVWSIRTAHGSGSDGNNDGYPERFSNTQGSNASSVGFYLTAETYLGKHGLSLRMDGLSQSNSNVRDRAVVIHGATYVVERNVQIGRSWGCFAVAQDLKDSVIRILRGGSLIYADLSR